MEVPVNLRCPKILFKCLQPLKKEDPTENGLVLEFLNLIFTTLQDFIFRDSNSNLDKSNIGLLLY